MIRKNGNCDEHRIAFVLIEAQGRAEFGAPR
jgi:hypothetical protein